jgi:hypothetical protein
MVITNQGNVGIGTTAPGELLSLGTAGTTKGVLSLSGNTSGKIIIQPADAAGTYTLTLPTDDGTPSQFLQTNGSGVLTWATGGGGGSSALSGLTVATAGNTIDNTNYAQEWQWSTLAGASALKLSSTSTAAASNAQKMFEIALSGANGTTAQTTYGAYISNTHTNVTSGTNVALYLNASGATTANYGLIVNAGNVGIGTTAPAKSLDVLTSGAAQLRLTQTAGSVYSELQSDATGDLLVSTTGSDVRLQDGNLWVCSGGSCAPSDPAEHGNIIVETSIILDNNFRLKQTGSTTVDMLDSGANVILEFDQASF